MKPISHKKQKLINDYINSPLKVGEDIKVIDDGKIYTTKVINILDNNLITINDRYGKNFNIKLSELNFEKFTYNIGANPINKNTLRLNPVLFSIDSILFGLGLTNEKDEKYHINNKPIKNLNWNPFVFDKKGNKIYYQRDFVWNLNDKQMLIDSIYNNIGCGTVIIRKRGFKELEILEKRGETDLFFYDVIDGKQRLKTLEEFFNNIFPDIYGNYFNDLSNEAQNHIKNSQLINYSETYENVKDENVLKQFINLNCFGIAQDKNHINYIKSIKI